MAQLLDKYREHPGILLKDRFLDPFRLTTQAVSRATSIDEVLLRQIIEGSQEIDRLTISVCLTIISSGSSGLRIFPEDLA
jgi:plasmid maintenance system antidote protein VapI